MQRLLSERRIAEQRNQLAESWRHLAFWPVVVSLGRSKNGTKNTRSLMPNTTAIEAWEWSRMIFLWIKALHVAAVVAWLGGLLMLSLMLGALATAPVPNLPQERRLMIAVGRWDRAITTPAMMLAWVLGITMAIHAGWFASPWLAAKLILVVALSALHGVMAATLRRMSGDNRRRPSSGLRFAGGFTVAATAAIALLVVLKPF
jgi:protoporphyrinogen IX oxidase